MKRNLAPWLAAVLLVAVVPAWAQTSVNPNGTLGVSTATTTVDNVLNVGPGTTGFNFSGTTGSFSLPAQGAFSSGTTPSANGYFYADYLITVTGSRADSVTTSIQDPSGVGNLSERIYSYNPASGTQGFLGDMSFAAAGDTGIQVWSTNYPLPGVNVSIVSPTDLTAGNYVIELRGTSIGNFGGTLSVTPVPEPQAGVMLMAGLAMLVLVWRSRRRR